MQKRLLIEDVVTQQQAKKLVQLYESPLYVYRESIIRQKVKRILDVSAEVQVCYAIKANTNTSIVKIIKDAGIQHIDATSPGQVYKALYAGFRPHEIVYTENFMTEKELDYALKAGVILNIGQLTTLQTYKDKLRGQKIYLRINPKVGAGTSHHVITGGPQSKFGIYENDILESIRIAKENGIHIIGLHQHIGSNIKKQDQSIVLQTMRFPFGLLHLFDQVQYINIGGGLGVAYKDQETISDPKYLIEQILKIKRQYEVTTNKSYKIVIQPGRFFVADSSVLLCTVTATKKTPEVSFIGTDTGFNHLIRPALYGSYHRIINLTRQKSQKAEKVRVCGNICECTDVLGDDIELEGHIGDILGIQNAGAYGFSMSSNYNERLKPAEVLINTENKSILIRRRETFEDLIQKL